MHSLHFYPRPPRGGRRARHTTSNSKHKFLSTPSARRATTASQSMLPCHLISIHALREEGDQPSRRHTSWRVIFLSTPSARRATDGLYRQGSAGVISIHALREEGDTQVHTNVTFSLLYFYPRPPRGGRQTIFESNYLPYIFLSTPSARRATAKTERKPSAFVSLYTSLHKLQRGACKTNRRITLLLVQTAGIPVRSVRENHVRCLFALAGHQKISTLSCANSGCSPTCSTLVW